MGQDYRRALELYSALAESGEPHGQFMMGDMYIRGLGVERNEDLACKWFESAAAGGNVNAPRNSAVLRILKGEWSAILVPGKAIALTIYLRLFSRHSDRLFRA